MIEHVLDAVEVVEDAGQHAFLELIEQVEKNLHPPVEDGIAQCKELLVGDATLFESRRILRPAQRQVRADLRPQRFREGGRGGVMPGRVQGMDLQGQGVDAHRAPQFSQDEAGDGVDVEERPSLELQFNDVAPLPQFQFDFLIADDETRARRIERLHRHRQGRGSHSASPFDRGAAQRPREATRPRGFEPRDGGLFLRLVFGGKQCANPQLAADIGRAESGQGVDRQVGTRREHGRPPQGRGGIAHARGFFKEGFRGVRRDEAFAQRGFLHRQNGHVRDVRVRVAQDEVEDAVVARVGAGGDARP